jgi:hypothetical protein
MAVALQQRILLQCLVIGFLLNKIGKHKSAGEAVRMPVHGPRRRGPTTIMIDCADTQGGIYE